MRRAAIIVLALSVSAAPLTAQGGARFPRKWIMAGVGALVSGAIAGVYAVHFERDIGGCSAVRCVVGVTVAAGAFLGFLMGSEMDRLYGLRYAHAPPLSLRGVELRLNVVPNDLALGASTVFVTGEQAVELIRAGPRLERLGMRARGLRGIGPITADSAANTMFVGTGVGLYRFPLRGDAPGTLAHPGEISAMSGYGEITAIGLGPDFQLVRIADSIIPLGDPVPEMSRVVDLAWQSSELLWVLSEDRLASYAVRSDGGVSERGEFVLPSIGRRFAIADTVAVIAAGSGGIYLLDIRNPDEPTEISNWSGARFAYDATIAGGLIYLAAGPEGLYVTRLEEGRIIPVGLARQAGFVAAVEADGPWVYLLDRTGAMLRRVPAGEVR